jgi:hypothetical protein
MAMKASVAVFSLFALGIAGALSNAACGGIEISFPSFDASPTLRDAGRSSFDGGTNGSNGSNGGGDDYDASWDWPAYDAGPAPVMEPDPDGGPPPATACGPDADAAPNDSGIDCPVPPSTCLDDHWARYYYGGTCGDAGVCEYQSYDMFCEPSGMPPDCYQGGCRLVVLR